MLVVSSVVLVSLFVSTTFQRQKLTTLFPPLVNSHSTEDKVKAAERIVYAATKTTADFKWIRESWRSPLEPQHTLIFSTVNRRNSLYELCKLAPSHLPPSSLSPFSYPHPTVCPLPFPVCLLFVVQSEQKMTCGTQDKPS